MPRHDILLRADYNTAIHNAATVLAEIETELHAPLASETMAKFYRAAERAAIDLARIDSNHVAERLTGVRRV